MTTRGTCAAGHVTRTGHPFGKAKCVCTRSRGAYAVRICRMGETHGKNEMHMRIMHVRRVESGRRDDESVPARGPFANAFASTPHNARMQIPAARTHSRCSRSRPPRACSAAAPRAGRIRICICHTGMQHVQCTAQPGTDMSIRGAHAGKHTSNGGTCGNAQVQWGRIRECIFPMGARTGMHMGTRSHLQRGDLGAQRPRDAPAVRDGQRGPHLAAAVA